jgi:hypothetical protein
LLTNVSTQATSDTFFFIYPHNFTSHRFFLLKFSDPIALVILL